MKMYILPCLLLSVFLFFRECCGQENEGSTNCSYWYEVQPFSQNCSHGAAVSLICRVYAPEETHVDVRWHLTELEDDDLNNETQINVQDIASGVYSLQNNFPIIELPNVTVDPRFAGLFRGDSLLVISGFAENQTGYYWCQMVISESIFLEPSQPASLTIGGQEGCSRASFASQPAKCVVGPEIPVAPTTTVQVSRNIAEEAASSTPSAIGGPTTATIHVIQVSRTSTAAGEASSTPSPTSATAECEAGGVSCFVYAGVGVAIIVIVLCSLAIFTVVFCVVNRKRSKKQHSRESIERVSIKGPKAHVYGDTEHVVLNDLYEPHAESKSANEDSESCTKQQQSEAVDHEYDAIKSSYYTSCSGTTGIAVDSKPTGNTYEHFPNQEPSKHQDKKAVLSQAHPSSLEYEYVTPEQARRYTHASRVKSTQEELYDVISDSKMTASRDQGNSPNSDAADDSTKQGHEYDRPDDAVSSKKGNGKKEAHEYEQIPDQQPLNSGTAQHKQEHYYHTLEGPAPDSSESNSGDNVQSNTQKPTLSGKSCEHKYDEPILYADTKLYDRSSDVSNHARDETHAPSSPLFDDLIYQTAGQDPTLPQDQQFKFPSGAQYPLGELKGVSTPHSEMDMNAQSIVHPDQLHNKAQSEVDDKHVLAASPVPSDMVVQVQPNDAEINSLQLGTYDDGMLFDDPTYQV